MRLSMFAAAVLCVSSLAAHADTLYTYTGQDFTSTSGSVYTTSDSVMGTLLFASPLAANLFEQSVTPLSFSFSDGVQTINQVNATLSDFFLSTDAGGDITSWSIFLQKTYPAEIGVRSVFGDYGQNADSSNGFNSDPGSFSAPTTTSITPEPSSIALLGTGLLGVAGVVRRRLVG